MTCVATTCGATRPMLVGSGWQCDGTDLVIVFPASPSMPPAVIRRDLLPYLDESSDRFLAENGGDFSGGDHLHLRLPIPLAKPRGTHDDAE